MADTLKRSPSGKPEVIKANEIEAAAHAIGLANQLEATLTGWVLGFDRDEVSKILDPIYTALDEEVTG